MQFYALLDGKWETFVMNHKTHSFWTIFFPFKERHFCVINDGKIEVFFYQWEISKILQELQSRRQIRRDSHPNLSHFRLFDLQRYSPRRNRPWYWAIQWRMTSLHPGFSGCQMTGRRERSTGKSRDHLNFYQISEQKINEKSSYDECTNAAIELDLC